MPLPFTNPKAESIRAKIYAVLKANREIWLSAYDVTRLVGIKDTPYVSEEELLKIVGTALSTMFEYKGAKLARAKADDVGYEKTPGERAEFVYRYHSRSKVKPSSAYLNGKRIAEVTTVTSRDSRRVVPPMGDSVDDQIIAEFAGDPDHPGLRRLRDMVYAKRSR